MTLKSGEVRVAVTGTVSRGPLTLASPPTGTTGPVPAEMDDLGFLDEKGFTEDPNKSTKSLKAWQNGTEVRTLVSDAKLTYKFRMIQSNKVNTETFFGTTVTQTSVEGAYVIDPIKTGGRHTWLFDVLDGAQHKRIFIPEGEVTDTSAITYSNSDETGYEITISAYYNATIGGNAQVWDTSLAKTA